MAMTPSRAYLLRALNEWIIDNQCTPYIVVDATMDAVKVPEQYVRDGRIVLNINPPAVHNLLLANEAVSFEARFGGQPHAVYVPMEAVSAIYAKENGRGMVFGWEEEPTDPETPPEPPGDGEASGKPSKPQLKVIK